MGLGSDPETIKERVTLPCQVYVSDFMIQNYPQVYEDLKKAGCTFSTNDRESDLYFCNKYHLASVKTLLYT